MDVNFWTLKERNSRGKSKTALHIVDAASENARRIQNTTSDIARAAEDLRACLASFVKVRQDVSE